MELIVFLILGALVGYVATHIMNRPEGVLGSTAFGVLGALLGAWLVSLVGENHGVLEFNLGSVLAALLGACVLVGIVNYVQRKKVR